MKFSRRKLLRYSLAASCVGLGGYVWQIEPRWTSYDQRTLAVPGLMPDLVGKTLIQLSDLHVGRQVADDYLRNQFEYINSLSPDFVVYTGDFVDNADSFHFEKLKRIGKRLPLGSIGTAGVLGNHDYVRNSGDCTMALKIANYLQDVGIEMLFDSAVELGGLTIAGLEDFWSPRFVKSNSRNLIQSLPQSSSIVLSHNPDTADLPIWKNFQSWILCGHTHGGQCRVPGFSPPLLPVQNRNYVAGTYQLAGGHQMYINRGLGHTLKVRFCVRPEVTVFTLQNA